MRYKLTPEAENDLIEIYVYGFLNFGEIQADPYFSKFEESFEVLGNAPLICQERTNLLHLFASIIVAATSSFMCSKMIGF